MVRYVGRSKYDDPRKRLRGHLSDYGGSRKADWIRGVKVDGGKVVVTTLEFGLTLDASCVREKFHIARCLSIGHPLTNVACRGWQESATPKHHLRFEARDALAYWAF